MPEVSLVGHVVLFHWPRALCLSFGRVCLLCADNDSLFNRLTASSIRTTPFTCYHFLSRRAHKPDSHTEYRRPLLSVTPIRKIPIDECNNFLSNSHSSVFGLNLFCVARPYCIISNGTGTGKSRPLPEKKNKQSIFLPFRTFTHSVDSNRIFQQNGVVTYHRDTELWRCPTTIAINSPVHKLYKNDTFMFDKNYEIMRMHVYLSAHSIIIPAVVSLHIVAIVVFQHSKNNGHVACHSNFHSAEWSEIISSLIRHPAWTGKKQKKKRNPSWSPTIQTIHDDAKLPQDSQPVDKRRKLRIWIHAQQPVSRSLYSQMSTAHGIHELRRSLAMHKML